VPWFDVAMKYAALVSVMNCACDFGDQFCGAPDRHYFARGDCIELSPFDKFHAEVTGAIALADFVNRNNAWMLEAGGGFCFATESLKMCFRRPVTKAYDFERHCAVETFLPRAINHALTAATDFFEQFVIAECCLHPYGARSHFPRARRSRPTCIRRLVDFIYEQAKTRLQKTGR